MILAENELIAPFLLWEFCSAASTVHSKPSTRTTGLFFAASLDRRCTSRLGIVVSGFIRVDPNYNEMNWNGDFSWFERNFPWSFKVSSKFWVTPSECAMIREIWGSDIQPQLRQRFYQWLTSGLSIWRLSGLTLWLWSSFDQLPCIPCRKVCYPAIWCYLL